MKTAELRSFDRRVCCPTGQWGRGRFWAGVMAGARYVFRRGRLMAGRLEEAGKARGPMRSAPRVGSGRFQGGGLG